MTRQKTRFMLLFALVAGMSLLLSQLSSYLINRSIPQGETVVVNSLLHLTHIRNLGGVFGMFQGSGWLFGLLSLLLILGLVVYLWKSSQLRSYEYLCFGFIVGGGGSNILDRFIYGGVIDYYNIQHIPYWHYIFNTADIMVHVGLWPMIFFAFFGPGQGPGQKNA